ncbi:DUF2213 domain-containing protein [Pseudooceanicola atlanticus]|uniref:DUF2213 domain-containing protein n=1 Tax=Pseudooceanicola atlanticus TaxID=1461694 RepID=UPI000A4F79E9|nr:DUF2213 domain-containing protein [Pseudooceanicola atlanticus]
MTKRVRVNVRSLANTNAVRRETRNGRQVIIVPSATLPDDVVMNRIQYPADEIEKSFRSLNRTPAPHGHPMIGNRFVSARDPEGINVGYIGAWNENARRENGRVFLDKVIDVTVANRSDEGKAVIDAINKGEPIHTSTGLLCNLEEGDGKKFDFIARDIEFDHDAILLNEEGAATPDQGVGMLVNAKGETEEIEVINSALEEAERELEWAADWAIRAVDKMERASIVERIASAIKEALRGASERETSAANGEADMAVSDEQFNALSEEVKSLSDSIKGIGDTVANAVTEAVKPIKEHVDQIDAANKAKEQAELADLTAKIVKANLMDEDTAKELTLNAARALAKKAEPGKAAALNGASGGSGGDDDEWADYSLNAAIDGKKKEAA